MYSLVQSSFAPQDRNSRARMLRVFDAIGSTAQLFWAVGLDFIDVPGMAHAMISVQLARSGSWRAT